jgi:uncharacterized protein YbjT (DUF2867 family)
MKIVVAGGTGTLGALICKFLIAKGAHVHVLARKGSHRLTKDIGTIHIVEYDNVGRVAAACEGAGCIVSAVSGLRDVIIEAQSKLLEAALVAGVPRIIPSDYCIDYAGLRHGDNRNLDLRREFATLLEGSKIQATSILNGMFTDLLSGQAPVILQKYKRIFFWGDPDQKMDFTTIKNTAQFTAAAALDNSSPRLLRIAGEEASMRDIKDIASSTFKQDYKFLRPGGLSLFRALIAVTKTLSPGQKETFPAWQGMQYLHDMLSGIPKHASLDNSRYDGIAWEDISSVLKR